MIGACVIMLVVWVAALVAVTEFRWGPKLDPNATITAYLDGEARLAAMLDKAFPASARVMTTNSESPK